MQGTDGHLAAWTDREDQAQAELLRRLAALDSERRRRLLAFLAGYAPDAVRDALDAIESADQAALAEQLRARREVGEQP